MGCSFWGLIQCQSHNSFSLFHRLVAASACATLIEDQENIVVGTAFVAIIVRRIAVMACFVLAACSAYGQASTVILQEPGFPVTDSAVVSAAALQQGFTGAKFVTVAQLSDVLGKNATALLVMPYGSSYPEAAWPAILRYLERGGDLIVLGGKPFTRAAFQSSEGWQLRAPSVGAALELFIADYQQTPGSSGLHFDANDDVQPALPTFEWTKAFSPVIRLSVTPMFPGELGSTGDDDADLTTLAWGSRGEHHRAAPAFVIDHYRRRFVGGRWIFLACEPVPHGFDDSRLLTSLQAIALRQHDRFTLQPEVPLFLPGEALELHFELAGTGKAMAGDMLKLSVSTDAGAPPVRLTLPANSGSTITLPSEAAAGKGLHTVEATLLRDGVPLWTCRSAFWMRDWSYLTSGSKLTVGSDYFDLDGKPLPVVGTTYMASDANRLFLARPNAYVWNRDMAQIQSAGLNMIRSGIWSAWRLSASTDGTVSERTLRTIEAFLMTARHNNLPVQFNLFSFLPDNFGGENAYLDPAALHAQDNYVRSLVERFHDVPFLAWDLINEPSGNENTWRTLPQRDAFERAAWREWLTQKYPDEAALLAAWTEPSFGMGRALQSNPSPYRQP